MSTTFVGPVVVLASARSHLDNFPLRSSRGVLVLICRGACWRFARRRGTSSAPTAWISPARSPPSPCAYASTDVPRSGGCAGRATGEWTSRATGGWIGRSAGGWIGRRTGALCARAALLVQPVLRSCAHSSAHPYHSRMLSGLRMAGDRALGPAATLRGGTMRRLPGRLCGRPCLRHQASSHCKSAHLRWTASLEGLGAVNAMT